MIDDGERVAWAQVVDRALDTLTHEEQWFLRLSYFAGFDQARISSTSGTPPALVALTIARGMQKLALALELSAPPAHPPVAEPPLISEWGIGA